MPKFMTKNNPREAPPSLIPSSPQLWRKGPSSCCLPCPQPQPGTLQMGGEMNPYWELQD